MNKIIGLFLLIAPFSLAAQVITYDTIRVAADDERNIHLRKDRIATANRPEEPAPDDESEEPRGNLRIGATLGLSFSRNYSVFNIGPQVGYQFNHYFMAGAGMKYYYMKTRGYSYQSSYLYKNHLIGANIFGYVYPVRFFTLFAQPEINYLWAGYTDEATGERSRSQGWVPSLVVGGGLRVGSSHITLNYDLIQHVNSPYPSGFFVGISAFF
ncbi:MAG TPA: hypothetical protein DDW85_00490 [Porphyromonadaceae bacterium]|nr:hypothetical protein [Porphyromonadaceae bacterium]